MPALRDLTGQTFGRFTVLRRVPSNDKKDQRPYWDCVCECGAEKSIRGDNLRDGQSKSCGCYKLARLRKHGLCKDLRMRLLYSARQRAIKAGIAFTITLNDIPEIPPFCPVLGISLEAGGGGGGLPTSPSLDRIIPSLGYVPGNVQIISHRANTIKSDASAEELQKVTDFVRKGEN